MIFLFTLTSNAQKTYKKVYYANGHLKAEGWIENGVKINYWHFYRENGTKHSEGHFIDGKKNNWWLFYDDMEKVNHKCQLENNQKNGYCLMYNNEKLVSARKYKNGKQIKEWTTFVSFKRENKLSDLI
ncbi:hypothetical protein [uncultured Algibacter sp.]|uniref:toxin-antitoxin system YwqK family antitoxin n=1 Tax=uncultured Algibacter sp. TaxID=298659 RepID=UPI00261145C2|nr:hypothetical protein [uncultured Algibacter sp.]